MCLLLGLASAFQVYPIVAHATSEVSSAWDPRGIDELPPEFAQGPGGIGQRLFALATVDYSFGTAVGADGSIYYTAFKGELRRLTPQGEVKIVALNKPGAYGVAVDREGNAFVGFESTRRDGGILRVTPEGEQSFIVEGLYRPRQLFCDEAGNVWFVIEDSREICRWNRESGAVETILDGLKCPQGLAVTSDGTVYYSEYGVFGEAGVALEPGSVHRRTPDGAVRQLASGFWRARGIALDAQGNVYVTSEANAWDQGSSGALFKISPQGEVTPAAVGLDYPQFPAVDAAGRVVFTVCRDNLVLAYAPQAEFAVSQWPGQPEIEVAVCGGTWGPDVDGEGSSPLRLEVEELVLEGRVLPSRPDQAVSIWVRLPEKSLALGNEQIGYPLTPGLPGLYALPEVESVEASRLFTLPVRRHVRSRWPVHHNEAGTELAAEGFDESPEAFLVYMDFLGSAKDTKGESDVP